MSQDTPTVDPLRFALSPWAFTGDEIALVRKRLEEAMRAALSATQPAQAAQSPYAWAVSGLTNLFTGPHAEYDARQEAKHCGGTAEAFPLFRDAQAQQSEPAKPLFASKVAARKWAELQDDGARMQSIAFDGHKSGRPGTIDPWGVVLWDQAQQAVEVVALPLFDELDDEAIDEACAAGSIYRADFMRAWNALRDWRPYYTTPPAPAQPAQGVPDATEEMLVAGLKECEPLGELIDWREGFGRDEMRAVWQAMLTASTTTPAQQGEPT